MFVDSPKAKKNIYRHDLLKLLFPKIRKQISTKLFEIGS